MTRKIDLASAPVVVGSLYPPPFGEPCLKRHRVRLGDAAGITQYGVNLCTLPPGTWTSQRHWHSHEDEFVYVVEGEVVLLTDDGEEVLRAGDCAGFKAGDPNGHCVQNRSGRNALVLEIGTRDEQDAVEYSDIDMKIDPGGRGTYLHKDGTPYPERSRSG